MLDAMHGFEMTPERRSAMARDMALAALRTRDAVKGYIAEADAAGKKRDALRWRSQLKKVEKLIAMYGLDRYAPRT